MLVGHLDSSSLTLQLESGEGIASQGGVPYLAEFLVPYQRWHAHFDGFGAAVGRNDDAGVGPHGPRLE